MPANHALVRYPMLGTTIFKPGSRIDRNFQQKLGYSTLKSRVVSLILKVKVRGGGGGGAEGASCPGGSQEQHAGCHVGSVPV